MKRIISTVLLLILIFSLTGCNRLNDKTDNTAIETSDSETTEVPVKDTTEIPLTDVTEVSVADDSGRIYKLENNVLYGKGENYEGILGEKEYYNEWIKIAEDVKMFDAYASVLIYLTTDGEVYGCGKKSGGVLQIRTDPLDFEGKEDKPVLLFDDCKHISLGCRFVLAHKNDGSVWFWGESLNGQSTQIVDQIITPIKIVEQAKMIKAIMYTTAWIDTNNTLYMCGDNSRGQIGNGKKGTGFPTMQKDIFENPYAVIEKCVNVYCSEDRHFVYADTEDGSTYVWGGNEYTKPTNIKNIDNTQ